MEVLDNIYGSDFPWCLVAYIVLVGVLKGLGRTCSSLGIPRNWSSLLEGKTAAECDDGRRVPEENYAESMFQRKSSLLNRAKV
ncbi:unnamed protein product [Allacma fusca]|uniref:Uncharacterized protein n=1 Tax=Allacma fusca TaxID=39272 RepID=A0A8J2IXT0_9HEXA|nr:unnamed protein product [Allacma fusca]